MAGAARLSSTRPPHVTSIIDRVAAHRRRGSSTGMARSATLDVMSDPDQPGAVPPPTPPQTPQTPPPDSPTLPQNTPIPPQPATTQMPVTQVVAGAGMPPGPPPDTIYGQPGEELPWYKRPGPLLAVLVALLAIGGLVAWFLLSGGDDDEPAAPGASRLTIEARDATGAALDRGFLISVTGPAGSENSYTWLSPADATPGQITGDGTGADGRVEFEWQPDDTVPDPATWAAAVRVIESVPAGWTAPGPVIDCDLQRVGEDDSVVSMNAAVTSNDPGADQEVTYTFPNYAFRAGDAVMCELTSVAPVETTTTTSTTIEETTTTVAETTTSTVAPSTTLPIVTVPPQPEATLWDVIVNSPDLSELRALVELAGLQDVLSDPNATLTLLAPSNEAITTAAAGVGAPDFSNPSVVESILLTHVDNTQALLIRDLFALDPPEFVVANPGPHEIDTAANPPTIGGATVLVADVEASNGVLHVIDKVLLPTVLPE